ncbi:MAG: HAMP domain-containing protein [Deltaproteobacteria bacterium]|nr:HAMP domain-containing protein [Deltaproteobacteria bacterium]
MFLKKVLDLRHTLAFRLTLWYASIFTLSACIAFLIFYFVITALFQERTDKDLLKQVGVFTAMLNADGVEAVKRLAAQEVQASGEKKVFFRLLYPTGISFSSSNMSFWRDIGVTRASIEKLMDGSAYVYETIAIPLKKQRVRIIYSAIGSGIILQLGYSMENVTGFFQAFQKVFIPVMLALIIVSAGVGWFMARRALAGVGAVTRTARKISADFLEERVPVPGKGDEIDRLARTFNTMLDRIEQLVSGIKEISDNVAHDLKGPITAIRGAAEIVLTTGKTRAEFEQMGADTIEACDHLLDMINTMLTISKTEAGIGEFQPRDLDIDRTVQDACELFSPMALDQDLELRCETAAGAIVAGDVSTVQRMIANLIDNAIKYTPPGGKIDVTTGIDPDGRVVISVKDTGIGISAKDLRQIFDRFFRCDPSRSKSGAGLGLSLAKAVAEAHKGSIEVSSTVNKGSHFTVALPNKIEV